MSWLAAVGGFLLAIVLAVLVVYAIDQSYAAGYRDGLQGRMLVRAGMGA